MLVGRLRPGMEIGKGVAVVSTRRDRDFLILVLSTSPEAIRIHKTRHVAELFVGHLPAESLMDSHVRTLKDVRASSKDWRGENVGKKGERTIAKYVSYDSRAVAEMHSR